MSEVPAGVIMPKELLAWLRDRRDIARECQQDYDIQGDHEEAEFERGYSEAMSAVIQHIAYST